MIFSLTKISLAYMVVSITWLDAMENWLVWTDNTSASSYDHRSSKLVGSKRESSILLN